MADIIQLLPEHVANQIAAGEVIQRPASAVKELMENAVDAGAKSIQLIIKDGGRTLVQVIDNGCGMSEPDARMAFARHATSKIRQADDLWAIRTMGFRGEAMASIAAVAQVEMRTRLTGQELGTLLEIEGSEVKRQEAVACPNGTSIAIKNLFFNVPARRNFLKSNPVETKHIFDEFQRVALAFPDIAFSLNNNGQEVYRLMPGTFKQRIVGLMGQSWNERLIAVKEETSVVTITGFVGKPDASRKTRGEQFFFINNRFIKSTYLNHAVQGAFQGLIAADSFPVYFLRFDVDPKTIDINIHPTKTEIKFEDERSVYAILRSAVRKAIGAFSLSPTLDFEMEQAFEIPLPNKREIKAPEIQVNPDYNPFSNPRPAPVEKQDQLRKLSQARWEDLAGPPTELTFPPKKELSKPAETPEKTQPWQLHGKYICTQVRSGLMLIEQTGAFERIHFERLLKQKAESGHHGVSQQLLFPVVKEFSSPDFELIRALEPELRALGFDFENFGKTAIAVNGVPPEVQELDIKNLFDSLLEQFKRSQQDLQLNRAEQLAKTLAANAARSASGSLSPEKMLVLIDQLFACESPAYTPSGRSIISIIPLEELDARFGR
ncbi:MAG TPA: DNA mismatch repair endonuclease MutL [Flavobacteriales bacterium]|nr:DNA mismatch repair endonuclease MutL [Flavobacteriales bacterium]